MYRTIKEKHDQVQRPRSLALFDLDNTLLDGDSDYQWGCFLAEKGIVDGAHYRDENRRFYQAYERGELDILEFLAFQLAPLAQYSMATLLLWREIFLREKIEAMILPKARQLIQNHCDQGDLPVIITATNRFITAPVAERLGVEHLLATEPEILDGRYTGNIRGVPCFRDGKIVHLEQWLLKNRQTLKNSFFYTDSHNDIPLLEKVDHPVAVDPDVRLRRHAEHLAWPVISLRVRNCLTISDYI